MIPSGLQSVAETILFCELYCGTSLACIDFQQSALIIRDKKEIRSGEGGRYTQNLRARIIHAAQNFARFQIEKKNIIIRIPQKFLSLRYLHQKTLSAEFHGHLAVMYD